MHLAALSECHPVGASAGAGQGSVKGDEPRCGGRYGLLGDATAREPAAGTPVITENRV